MAMLLRPKPLIVVLIAFMMFQYAVYPLLAGREDAILVIEAVPYVFAFFALQHVARAHEKHFRAFWGMLSWGSACYALGLFSWIAYDWLWGDAAPIFSLADLFWALQSIINILALVYLLTKERGAYRGLRLMFDTVIFVTIAGVMSWEFVIYPHLDSLLADSGWWGVAVTGAYPLASIAILGCLFMLFNNGPPTPIFIPFFSGFAVYIVADTSYMMQISSTGAYLIGDWADPLYGASILLIVISGAYALRIKPDNNPLTADDRIGTRTRYALTYGSLIAMLTLMVCRMKSYDMGVPFYASLAIVVLVIIRQVTVLLENDALLRQAQHNLQRTRTLAFYDQLSLLPNRRYFEMKAKTALEQAEQQPEGERSLLAVLFLDLDRFKYINDSFGHDAGDALIQAVTERLTALAEGRHFVARMGGDEFTMLCEVAGSMRDLQQLAQRVLEEIARPIRLEQVEVFTTASIGIAVYPKGGTTVASLLKNADIALYKAKSMGKNRAVVFTEQFNQELSAKMQLESELRGALARGELTLVYQPQIEAASGRIAGVEALLRWRKETGGTVSPAEFIPVAEDTGLIVSIGTWVLRTACLQAKRWMDEGHPAVCMSVNVSPRQFSEAGFVRAVAGILRETALPPERLVLEITEGLAIQDEADTIRKLRALKRIGVRIFMDDFGTGYSSLGYLKKFEVDALKIAQDFISEVGGDPDKASIVKAILAMAGSLKLKVIAEGVETKEQYDFLRENGCDWIQGYYCHRPLPMQEIGRLLGLPRPKDESAEPHLVE